MVELAPTAESFEALGKAYIDDGDLTNGIPALLRAVELGGRWHPEWFAAATPADLAAYIVRTQLPNGAIRISTGPAAYDLTGVAYYLIDPYFADLAVTGLLASSAPAQLKLDVAQKWIDWRLANTNPDGTIGRHLYYADGTAAGPVRAADADDSAAATFLSTVWAFHTAGGPASFFARSGVRQALDRIAGVIASLQQADGLTWVSDSYRVKYVADNSEVFAGVRDYAALLATVYRDTGAADAAAVRAERVRAGILNQLYNTQTGLFDISLQDGTAPQPADLDEWYSNKGISVLILWPALMGVISPTSQIARTQMAAIDGRWDGSDPLHPAWTTRTDWAAVGFEALTIGDTAGAAAYFATATQGPYPTPIGGRAGYVSTVADAGFLLRMTVPVANDDVLRPPAHQLGSTSGRTTSSSSDRPPA